jgi:hypothetical protein
MAGRSLASNAGVRTIWQKAGERFKTLLKRHALIHDLLVDDA